MCRSSTTSIGFLLLLWIGIVLPATEQQLALLAEESPLGVSHSALVFSSATTDQQPGTQAQGNGGSQSYSVSLDLSDYNMTWPSELGRRVARVSEPSAGPRLLSRSPDPQERPPKRLV